MPRKVDRKQPFLLYFAYLIIAYLHSSILADALGFALFFGAIFFVLPPLPAALPAKKNHAIFKQKASYR